MIDKEIMEKHISVNPDIQHGRPCIKGTRIPVYTILETLATGMSFTEVKREYHPVTDEDIRACIFFAALLADEEELVAQPS